MSLTPITPVVEMYILDEPLAREGFEAAPPYDFDHADGGDGAWARATDQEYFGSWSLKTPTLSNGQFSDFNIDAPAGATKIRLWIRTDIGSADRLQLIRLQNTETYYELDSFNDWTQYEVPISGGQRLIVRYQRNAGGGNNACWIDDVQILADDWVDITEDVRLGDAHSGGDIHIKRGKPNEGAIAEPTECDLILNNRAGKYSELNPSSPYFGRIGRNQPLRVALHRTVDPFDRTASNSWGSTPDWTDSENQTRSGYAWSLKGTAANFDVASSEATIQAASGYQSATFGTYADVDIVTRVKVSARTSEFGIVLRQNAAGTSYYTAYVTPSGTDTIRIGRVTTAASFASQANLSSNIVANEWYWIRAQMEGRRARAKIWADGDAEPETWPVQLTDERGLDEGVPEVTGAVGLFAKDGSTLVAFSGIDVTVYRAHTEIVSLPVQFDLSQNDQWVKVKSRGLLQRLGQGRKALDSAVTLHYQQYAALSALWHPLESDQGQFASTAIPNGYAGQITSISAGTPELSGVQAMPGLGGYIHLNADDSRYIGRAIDYDGSAHAWSLSMFFQIDGPPATEQLLFRYTTTGTGATFKATLQSDSGMRIDVYAADGVTLLSTDLALLFNFGTVPTGSWIACVLYVFDSGGTVTWAWNYTRPHVDNSSFFTLNGSYSGTAGNFREVRAYSNSTLVAAGGIRLAQVLHYAGDLPFVTYQFADAAKAYQGEGNITRFLRLLSDAGIRRSHIGLIGNEVDMGPQLPNKLPDLLEECAAVGGGTLEEGRQDLEVVIRTKDSLYNTQSLPLDVDSGHLTEPLEPQPDDQQTRNDVTVTRPNGGFARSVQTSGPLNVNTPESDPDGVGTYDEAPAINFAEDSQLQGAADFRRSRGTLNVPRYPSLPMDLTASAYQDDPVLLARALAIDSGSMLEVTNPKAHPSSLPQIVQGYSEDIGQYDYDLVVVTNPGQVYQVGVSEYTTRVQPSNIVTSSPILVGTDTTILCRPVGSAALWVPTADDAAVADFDIEVAGVQFHVNSITGASAPQTINIDATPVNSVATGFTIQPGQRITLAQPWRTAW